MRLSLWDEYFRPAFGSSISTKPIVGIHHFGSKGNTLGVTIGNGDVFVVDLTTRSILSSSVFEAAEYTTRDRQVTIIGSALVASNNQSNVVETSQSSSISSTFNCNAIFPSWPGKWSCVGRNGTNLLQMIDLTEEIPTKLPEGSKLRKCSQHNYTLPGHVVSVDKGGYEVVFSEDLSSYLTSSTLAICIPSHSSSVSFDWHLAQGPSSGHSKRDRNSSLNNICDIRNRGFTLSEPYQGPSVAAGVPRVYLRTNLAIEHVVPQNLNPRSSMQRRVFRSIDLPDHVTALAQHPSLSLIVAGTVSGEIVILGQEGD